MAGFDKIQITRDTKANITKNLSKLNEFELVIATDEKKLYAKIQGKLEDLSGLVQSDVINDLNGGSKPVSADVAKQLNDAINVVKNTANKASTDSTQALKVANEAKNSVGNKLDRGGYGGTAKQLNDAINGKVGKEGGIFTLGFTYRDKQSDNAKDYLVFDRNNNTSNVGWYYIMNGGNSTGQVLRFYDDKTIRIGDKQVLYDGVSGVSISQPSFYKNVEIWNGGKHFTVDRAEENRFYIGNVSATNYIRFWDNGDLDTSKWGKFVFQNDLNNYCVIGSNSNGFFRKWSNGVLECWSIIECGNGATVVGTYPHKFINTNNIYCQISNQGASQNNDVGIAKIENPATFGSTTQYRVRSATNINNTSANYSIYFLGRWK